MVWILPFLSPSFLSGSALILKSLVNWTMWYLFSRAVSTQTHTKECISEARLEGPGGLDPMDLKDMGSKSWITINQLVMDYKEDMVTGAITRVQDWSWVATWGRKRGKNTCYIVDGYFISQLPSGKETLTLFALSTRPQNGVSKKMTVQQKLCVCQQVMQCKASRSVRWSCCWASHIHCAWFRVWCCGRQGGLFFGLALVWSCGLDSLSGWVHLVLSVYLLM